MIKERYCSYEVARLLKEKGFSEPVRSFYLIDDAHSNAVNVTYTITYRSVNSAKAILRPTHQMACDWLEKKYHLFLNVGFGKDIEGDFLYMVDIYDLTNDAVEGRYKPIVEADDYLTTNPKTKGEVIEAALKYVLEKLI